MAYFREYFMSYVEITRVALLICCERTRSLPTFWSIWRMWLDAAKPRLQVFLFFCFSPWFSLMGAPILQYAVYLFSVFQLSAVMRYQRCSGLTSLGAVTHILFGGSALTAQILGWVKSWLGFFLRCSGKTRKNFWPSQYFQAFEDIWAKWCAKTHLSQ